ncbi:MAG: Hpt domain-containing protein [Bradyrhizobium sp.]|uniref:Hpt domain-containing protein n=1 Tax=Bradyrhizobium sp. TaxID=376 RepID=UPI0025BA906D|nr:Hpt domain-containing protein [Bradyrhizobium sp.]MBI5264639.1 Hpt domain-containing protein [Bradyrhizobium sp.]
MRSPPLVPGPGPLDLDHLDRMTLGDAVLEREVLALFSEQSRRLISTIAALPADASSLAHTLKGSARGIGAFAVAQAAARLEAAVRTGEDRPQALADLENAVADACRAIEDILARP